MLAQLDTLIRKTSLEFKSLGLKRRELDAITSELMMVREQVANHQLRKDEALSACENLMDRLILWQRSLLATAQANENMTEELAQCIISLRK